MNSYLKKEDIERFDGTEKTHFLNDNAKRVTKSLGDLTGIKGFGFHITEIQPGHETTEFHRHYHEDECVYVVEGQAEAQIGEDVFAVKAGDFIGYPAGGDAHTIRNTGNTVLKCIVVGQRLDHDVCEYPLKDKRLYRNKGLSWALADIDVLEHPSIGR